MTTSPPQTTTTTRQTSTTKTTTAQTTNGPIQKGALLWSDEFNYNGAPNSSVWNVLVNGNNYNNEIQFYTNRTSNANVSGGFLTLTAKLEKYGARNYTSARLESKRTFTYGVFEMRAQLPTQGNGIWPAYWLFAYNLPWPSQYGEIDIMENVGWQANRINGGTWSTLNGSVNPQTGGLNSLYGQAGYLTLANTDTAFHTYTLDWNKNRIKFYADNVLFFTYNRAGNEYAWTFDKAFTLIVNSAIGGDFGGIKGVDNAILPNYFIIDYIRQYASIAP